MTPGAIPAFIAASVALTLIWRYRKEWARFRPFATPYALGTVVIMGQWLFSVPLSGNTRPNSIATSLVVFISILLGIGHWVRRIDGFSSQEKRDINILWACTMISLLAVANAIVNVITSGN